MAFATDQGPAPLAVRHGDDLAGKAGHARRRLHERQCTDTGCLVFLLLFLVGLWYIYSQARKEGNLAKLTHGFDWKGDICGVDRAVRDQPLLYWCDPGSAEDLSLLDGICVDRCPAGGATRHWCPGSARPFQYGAPGPGNASVREVVIGMVRNLTRKADYPTIEALGYCFPSRNVDLMNRIILRTHVSTLTKQLFLAGHGALESWRFLVGVAGACIIIGYAFLFVLWACFDKLVYGLVAVAHALLLLSATGFIYAGFEEDRNLFASYFNPGTARLCTWACGGAACIAWLLLCALCCYGRDALSATIDSVKASCEVIGHLPTMLLQPLMHSALVILLLLLLLYGFAWVLSTGNVRPSGSPVEQGGIEIAGLHRSFEFTGWQWFCIVYWGFGLVWIFEIVNALGQFAISHAVVVFACSDASECCPMLHGYAAGLGCHLGTLAFGGFVIGCLKILAALFAFLARQTKDDGSVQAYVAKAACCCCAYCAACIERVLKMVNDLVYTDVALQGSGYMEAAENVVRIAAASPATYALIKGSAGAVRVLGVTAIVGAGTLLSYQLLSSSALHRELDAVFEGARSMLTTSNIMGTTAAAGIVCFYVAMAFMMVFYQTTYTLMYCMLIGAVKTGDGYVRTEAN